MSRTSVLLLRAFLGLSVLLVICALCAGPSPDRRTGTPATPRRPATRQPTDASSRGTARGR